GQEEAEAAVVRRGRLARGRLPRRRAARARPRRAHRERDRGAAADRRRAGAPVRSGLTLLLALVAVAAAGAAQPQRVPRLRHVILVVFENRERGDVAGSSEARHFNGYAHTYAELTRYAAVAHPSLPNYLALVSGSTHGISDDCTDCAVAGPSLGTLLSRAGRSWGGYAQGYPGSPRFAKKHMPFLYFRGQEAHVHALAALTPRRLPAFALVAPDLCDDGHDCPLSVADVFLARFLPPFLDLPATAVFVIFDEGTTGVGGGGRVFAFA